MKKIIKYTLFPVICFCIASCSNYLDIKPRGYDVPHKLAHYEGLLYGKESQYMPVYYYMTFEHEVDAKGFTELNNMPNYGYNNSVAFIWQDTIFRADDQCSEWNMPCNMFYTLNVVVDEVMDAEDGTKEQKTAVLAEARFLRGWYTYMMAQWFGKPYDPATAGRDLCVPILNKASTVEMDFSRRTVEDVYSYIITEMTESLPLLPQRPAHQNRVFYAAGNAMLGKVYWMKGDYGAALPYLEAAKTALDNDSGRNLLNLGNLIDDEWGEIYGYPSVAYSPETVYVIATVANLWSAMGAMFGTPHRTLRYEVMEWLFDTDDYRLAFYTGVETFETAYVDFDPDVRYHTNMTNMSGNDGISVPDVYLMYAECLAREGYTGEARGVLAELRSKRMPVSSATPPATVASKDDLVKFTVEERFRESFGIGNNWFDMRRLWNDPLFQYLKPYYTRTDGTNMHTLTEARLTMKIPPAVMQWHPEYQQND